VRPGLDRLRDREGHAPVLERTGRVGALTLEPELDTEAGGEPLGTQERCRALAEREDRGRRRQRQRVAIALEQRRSQVKSLVR
jgi:hypothetical protein